MNKKICGSKLRKKEVFCQNTVIFSNGRCRMHGGKSLRGIASPTFKNGSYSKYLYLPERLSERVGEFIDDPRLIELRENIAVLDVRLTELYENLHKSEPAEVWLDLKSKFIEWQDGEKLLPKLEDDARERQIQMNEQMKDKFDLLLTFGANEQSKDERIWDKIISLSEQRRKLVDSESKRVKDSQQSITTEEFNKFVRFILAVILENVPDHQTRARIAEQLNPAKT